MHESCILQQTCEPIIAPPLLLLHLLLRGEGVAGAAAGAQQRRHGEAESGGRHAAARDVEARLVAAPHVEYRAWHSNIGYGDGDC